jgi:hypothetical protein
MSISFIAEPSHFFSISGSIPPGAAGLNLESV